MSFLNPLMLIGLVAASVPLLLHLFNRQKAPTLLFSSVAFIRSLERHQIRSIKLRQVLLLLLRTLLIVLLVVAFSRPTLEGVQAADVRTHEKTSVVLILDDSYSMGTQSTSETAVGVTVATFFARAKAAAEQILDLLQERDEVLLIRTSQPQQSPQSVLSHRLSVWKKELAEATLSSQVADMRGALEKAAGAMARTNNLHKEVYLLTDMQRTGWESFLQHPPVLDKAVGKLLLVDVSGPPRGHNLSIDRLRFARQLLEAGKAVHVDARVTNHGPNHRSDVPIHLYVEGQLQASRLVSLEGGQTATVHFTFVLDRPGLYRGRVELKDDGLETDNERYFTLHIPEEIAVLLVGDEEEIFFLDKALRPAAEVYSVIRPRSTRVDQLSATLLAQQRVVILADVAELTAPVQELLSRFVAAGGGVIFFLGDRVKPGGYHPLLTQLVSCSMTGTPRGSIDRQSYLTLDQVDYEHPIFALFKPDDRGGALKAPRFYATHDIALQPKSALLARFSNGFPAVVEGTYGQGRSLLFASAPNLAWSNLPLKGVFVPLINRTVRYLATNLDAASEGFLLGTAAEPLIGTPDPEAPLLLQSPDDTARQLKPRVLRDRLAVKTPPLTQPGIYQIYSGTNRLATFAANVESQESDLALLEVEELADRLPGLSVTRLPYDADLTQVILQARRGRELWRWAVLLALLCFVVEILLSSYWGRSKARPVPHPQGG